MSNVHHTSVWNALSISRNQNQELYCLLSATLLLPFTNFAFNFFGFHIILKETAQKSS